MMLPCPLSAMPGRDRCHELVSRTHVGCEELVERRRFEFGCWSEPREPAVVDENVHVARLGCKPSHVVGVAEFRSHEAGAATASSIARTVAAPRSASRPCTITVKPSLASFMATARPIPDVAPVTSATRGSTLGVLDHDNRL